MVDGLQGEQKMPIELLNGVESMKNKKILLAGIYHETHTFLDGLTKLEDCTIQRGDELYKSKGENSPMGGFMEVAAKNKWIVIPTIDLRAMPGPMIDDKVIDFYWRQFKKIAEPELSKGVDGIFLVLHGAMVSRTIDDVEGVIIEKIRKLKGAKYLPICGVIDLHANFSSKMAKYTNGLIAYTKNPHKDSKEAAIKGANLLSYILGKGIMTSTVWEHPSLMWPPTGTATAEDPMLSLEVLARKIENENKSFLAVNVLAGFAFADIPDTGVSFTIITETNTKSAKKEIKQLSKLALKLRDKGNIIYPGIKTILENIKPSSKGPIIIVEPSDNIGGGAPGNCTEALRALIKKGIKNTVCIINDPESVRKFTRLNLGVNIEINIGGKPSDYNEGPLSLNVKLISYSNGKFQLEDEKSHLSSMFGKNIDMGPCAVVQHKGTIILLTSKKTPPFDLGQLRSQGIIPEKQSVILVKAAVAHRQAYDPIAYKSYTVETLGPCSSNLARFKYRKIKRPIFPLDP